MIKLHFYTPNTFFGKLVSLATRSPISHVAIEHTIYGTQVLTQASTKHGGMVSRPNPKHTPAATLVLDGVSDQVVFDLVSPFWGMKYGWLDVLMFKVKPLTGTSGENFKGVMCSELAVRLLGKSLQMGLITDPAIKLRVEQVVTLHGGNPSDVSPGELHTMLMG